MKIKACGFLYFCYNLKEKVTFSTEKLIWRDMIMNWKRAGRIFCDMVVMFVAGAALLLSFLSGAKIEMEWSSWRFHLLLNDLSNISDGITSFTITFLGIITVFDLFDAFGWTALIPSFIREAKRKKLTTEISDILDQYYGENFSRHSRLLESYYKQDHIFAKSCDQARVNYILKQLGIKQRQYDDLLDGLARMRVMDLNEVDDVRKRIKHLLKTAKDVVIKQDIEPADRANSKVKYYIDFISITRDKLYREELAKTFAYYIKYSAPIEYKKVTKIVIPSDGNFLLGAATGEILDQTQVFIKSGTKGAHSVLDPWDGKLEAKDRIIIVYDVLATGSQIVDAIEKIKKRHPTIEILGAFCIVNRRDMKGKETVLAKNCKVYSILELDDTLIGREYYHE